MTVFIKSTIPLACNIHIDRKIVSGILDMAIDGSMHWVSQMAVLKTPNNRKDIPEQMLDGALIGIQDGMTGHSHELGTDKLIAGIRQYMEQPSPADGEFLKWEDHELKIDMSLMTEDIADDILQYALFHKIQYKDGVQID